MYPSSLFSPQVAKRCGLKMSLFSRGFPLPAGSEDIPAHGWHISNWWSGATLADAGESQLGVHSTEDVATVAEAKLALDGTAKLKGNVIANSVTGDIGDARGFATNVWPLDQDDGFYFTLEPMLPHSTRVWKIKYECSKTKRAKVSAAYAIVSNPQNGYGAGDVEYYRKLELLCQSTHYWCVEEDSSTGVNRFYLCPSITLAGTFQINFGGTTAGEIYAERSLTGVMSDEPAPDEDFDCVALFGKGGAETTKSGVSLHLGQSSSFDQFVQWAAETGWKFGIPVGIVLIFFLYIRFRLHPHDEDLEELHHRRRFWLSHPAHQTTRWNGGAQGISNLFDKSDIPRSRYN